MMNIFQVSQQYQQFLEMIENEEASTKQLADTLEAMSEHIEDTLENLSASYKNRLAYAFSLKEEAKKLVEKSKKQEKAAERTLQFMDSIMKANKLKVLDAGVHTLKYRKGSEVVEVIDSLIPTPEEAPDLYKIKPAEHVMLGKPELKKLIQSGKSIQGVHLVRKSDSLKVD